MKISLRLHQIYLYRKIKKYIHDCKCFFIIFQKMPQKTHLFILFFGVFFITLHAKTLFFTMHTWLFFCYGQYVQPEWLFKSRVHGFFIEPLRKIKSSNFILSGWTFFNYFLSPCQTPKNFLRIFFCMRLKKNAFYLCFYACFSISLSL